MSKQQGEAVRCSKEQVQPARTMVSDELADQVAGAGAHRGHRGVGAGGDHSAAWARREGHGLVATDTGDGCQDVKPVRGTVERHCPGSLRVSVMLV